MAQWTPELNEIIEKMDRAVLVEKTGQNVLHAFVHSWMNEEGALIWLTIVPGSNVFGSQVIFVNKNVLDVLHYSLEEWVDGYAPMNVMILDERNKVRQHLDAKSSLPILARLRRKSLNPNLDGEAYFLHFHHDLPYQLRVTVGIQVE